MNQPGQRICNNPFSPAITIRNRGTQTLTSLLITTAVDNTPSATYTWTGSLAQQATADITLNAITATTGSHVLKVYLSKPNNSVEYFFSKRLINFFPQHIYIDVNNIAIGIETLVAANTKLVEMACTKDQAVPRV